LPIMFYTNHHGRRSVVALERRENIAAHTQKKAGSSWRAANYFPQAALFEFNHLVLDSLVLAVESVFRWSVVSRSCGRMAK
jgi:hypothetical protein